MFLVALTAGCGAPSFTSRNAAEQRPTGTDPANQTRIGDAAVLDRSATTVSTPGTSGQTTTSATPYPPGVSARSVDGLELILQANETATFRRGTAVHLVLTVTNKTNRPIGYLTNRETHFALVDGAKRTIWTDETCRARDTETTFASGYLEIAPGEHVSVDDYYPTHPGTDTSSCEAPPGRAYLTGALTVCLNLAADDSCRGASDHRVQAMPLAVNVT